MNERIEEGLKGMDLKIKYYNNNQKKKLLLKLRRFPQIGLIEKIL